MTWYFCFVFIWFLVLAYPFNDLRTMLVLQYKVKYKIQKGTILEHQKKKKRRSSTLICI
jgi:hypothetical protein